MAPHQKSTWTPKALGIAAGGFAGGGIRETVRRLAQAQEPVRPSGTTVGNRWTVPPVEVHYGGSYAPPPSVTLPSSGTWQITAYVYIDWQDPGIIVLPHAEWTISAGGGSVLPVTKPGGFISSWADSITFPAAAMAGGTFGASYYVYGASFDSVLPSPFPYRMGLVASGVRVA